MRFDGETYDEQRDGSRLTPLFDRVKALVLDGQWRTLEEIADAVGAGSEASISARLRDLRKARFGEYRVERQYVRDGLWRYRVLPPAAAPLPSNAETEGTLFAPPLSRPSMFDVD